MPCRSRLLLDWTCHCLHWALAWAGATTTTTVTKTRLAQLRYHHRWVNDCIEIFFGFCEKVNRLIDKTVRQHRRWIRS